MVSDTTNLKVPSFPAGQERLLTAAYAHFKGLPVREQLLMRKLKMAEQKIVQDWDQNPGPGTWDQTPETPKQNYSRPQGALPREESIKFLKLNAQDRQLVDSTNADTAEMLLHLLTTPGITASPTEVTIRRRQSQHPAMEQALLRRKIYRIFDLLHLSPQPLNELKDELDVASSELRTIQAIGAISPPGGLVLQNSLETIWSFLKLRIQVWGTCQQSRHLLNLPHTNHLLMHSENSKKGTTASGNAHNLPGPLVARKEGTTTTRMPAPKTTKGKEQNTEPTQAKTTEASTAPPAL